MQSSEPKAKGELYEDRQSERKARRSLSLVRTYVDEVNDACILGEA